MAKDQEDKPASRETAQAALGNIRRMLKGEVAFPVSIEATEEMIKAAVRVEPLLPKEQSFNGTTEDVIAGLEGAVRMSANGVEFWSARELMGLLGYGTWKDFEAVIERASVACHQSGLTISEHFSEISEKSGVEFTERQIQDINVTRYGAYLIAQNGDTRKKQVAFAQTYFAVQTRRQELQADVEEQIAEQNRRIALRDEITEHNKDLAEAAKEAGVLQPLEYAAFQNAGYRGLYDGLDVAGIKVAKRLKGTAKILDHMGSTELAANLFRATQAEDKLRREGIRGKENANAAHLEVGQKVRKAIADIGGTMPEKLNAEEDINKIRQRLQKKIRQNKLNDFMNLQ